LSKSNSADTLDAFFPFDPLHLRKSREFVDSLYQVWESVDDDIENNDEMSEDLDGGLGEFTLNECHDDMDGVEYIY
jgi:hypothetical protein